MKIKHYEIEKLIGKGSFGDVYKGVDTRNGNTIALKLDTSGLKVLKHEVSILNYLQSENVSSIPKILWFGVIDNVSILTMTYYKTSLQDYFDVKGIIDEFKMSSSGGTNLLGISSSGSSAPWIDNLNKYFNDLRHK